MRVIFSHYSGMEVRDGVLEWNVTGELVPVISGQLSVHEAAGVGVREVGTVSFAVPNVEHPAKVRLALRLVSGGTLIASTEQEFYIFPPVAGAPAETRRTESEYSPEFAETLERLGYEAAGDLLQAELAVVSALDDSHREFLLRGGRVLLLAETDDAL